VYDLFPGVFATVEMIPDSVGDWMLHCHVNDHMTGGMETVYSVYGNFFCHIIMFGNNRKSINHKKYSWHLIVIINE